jgi:hypothetical protein
MLFQSIWLGSGGASPAASGEAAGRISFEHAQVVLISILLPLSYH